MTIVDKHIKRDFTESDWVNTPAAVKKAFENLETLVVELVEQQQIEQQVDKLKSQLNKNSSNSSKPPSSDSPYKKKVGSSKNHQPGNKKAKAGAKVGHKGQR